jgi:hypothetical protein
LKLISEKWEGLKGKTSWKKKALDEMENLKVTSDTPKKVLGKREKPNGSSSPEIVQIKKRVKK